MSEKNAEIIIDLRNSYSERHHKLAAELEQLDTVYGQLRTLQNDLYRGLDEKQLTGATYRLLMRFRDAHVVVDKNYIDVTPFTRADYPTYDDVYRDVMARWPTGDSFAGPYFSAEVILKCYSILGLQHDEFPEIIKKEASIQLNRAQYARKMRKAHRIADPADVAGGFTTAFDNNNTRHRSAKFRLAVFILATVIGVVYEFIEDITGDIQDRNYVFVGGLVVTITFACFDYYMTTRSHRLGSGCCMCLAVCTGQRPIHISQAPTLERTKMDRAALYCSRCFR